MVGIDQIICDERQVTHRHRQGRVAELPLKDRQVASAPQILSGKGVPHQMWMDVDITPFAPAPEELVESPGRELVPPTTPKDRTAHALLGQGVALHRPDRLW